MAHISLFPEDFRTLQKEIRHHKDLVERLKTVNDFALWMAEVATYCDVVVDAYYTMEDIANLCRVLTNRLYKKRAGLVVI